MTGFGVLLILVWTLSLTVALLEACATQGWFGPHCVFKCRCHEVCQQTGNCVTGDTCQSGYTGTACQYAYTVADAVDDRSGICTWMVQLSVSSWVTQVNVLVPERPPEAQRPENMTLRRHKRSSGDIAEAPLHFVREEGVTFVYRPRQPWLASSVCITAPSGLMTGCEVHVISGRNLALKKNASKSPDDTNPASGADKAVDYETNPNGPLTCEDVWGPAVTGNQTVPTVWKVYLGDYAVIWRVEIHNKMRRSIRNTSFHISVGVRNESMETVYETNATELESSTVISLDTPRNATDVYIIHSSGRTLSLCDVRIFGDCLDGYYGWLCEGLCNCKDPTEVCDKVLGSCPLTGCRTGRRGLGCQERCAPGYYGDGCEIKCHECMHGDCDHVNGMCIKGCLAGWTGDRCDEVCPKGTYGNNCNNTCSVHCEEQDCLPENGTCTKPCPPGQRGSFCDKECANGRYGYSCVQICGLGCVGRICHHVNGTCSHGCTTGLEGDYCNQESASVTFGLGRRDKCSTNCASVEPLPNFSGIFVTCFSIGFFISLAVYVTVKRYRCCIKESSKHGLYSIEYDASNNVRR